MTIGYLVAFVTKHIVVIHNDAGSINATAEWYVGWLRDRNKELGIAHYYIDRHTIARVIDTYKIGYHCGDGVSATSGNGNYIGYEVCQSMGASKADFLANEDMTLMQATEDLLFYDLPINEQTVRLHHEFVPTSCPHRSMELHGGTTASTKAYFIQRMKHFATLGKTVDEMLKGKPVSTTPTSPVQTTPAKAVQQPIGGTASMQFTFEVKGDKSFDERTIYYYNPVENAIIGLSHPDQLNILRTIHKDSSGRDLPHYKWTSNAPWYSRFMQVYKPSRRDATNK